MRLDRSTILIFSGDRGIKTFLKILELELSTKLYDLCYCGPFDNHKFDEMRDISSKELHIVNKIFTVVQAFFILNGTFRKEFYAWIGM